MAKTGHDRPSSSGVRWGLAAAVSLVLLAGGGFAVTRLVGTDEPDSGAAPSSSAGTPTPSPTPSPTPPPGADITGPLNLLIVGVDTRVNEPGWEPHADAVLIMHITAELDRAYLFSLPRDLVVDIPPFEKANFGGDERTKLTHAMSYGSRRPGKPRSPSAEQGLQLLSATVRDYTGIKKFDAAAVLTFGGFDNLVDAVGGVDLYIDQRVASQHRRPDGKHRPGGNSGYVGPQMVYQKGTRHLNGWQALDYARQRYITGGDYSRQRHQQQLIKALVGKILDQDLARDPDRMDALVRGLGKALVFEGGDQRVLDFAFALSGLRKETITLVSLPGGSVTSGGSYRGEALKQVGDDFIEAVRKGTPDTFLAAHPELVVRR